MRRLPATLDTMGDHRCVRHRPFIFAGHLWTVSAWIAEEIEMDPVSIILVGLSAVLMVALFIWSMSMLTTLDASPVESDE